MTTEPWTLNDGTVVPMQGNSIDPETWRDQTCETCAWACVWEGLNHTPLCRRVGPWNAIQHDAPACPAWVAR